MKLAFTPEADEQASESDVWWRANRPKAPGLFATEAAQAREPASGEASATCLPQTRRAATMTRSMTQASNDSSLRGRTILVVEDHAGLRQGLVALLKSLGMEVTSADCMTEALRVLREKTPMLLLSDLGLPDGDGCELIKQVRLADHLNANALPAVAMSAFPDPEVPRRALAAGFQAFLAKPFDADLLAAELAALAATSDALR
jgi:CheY-like chemotaxis protein